MACFILINEDAYESIMKFNKDNNTPNAYNLTLHKCQKADLDFIQDIK